MNQIFYTVQRGDSFYSISQRWEIPVVSLIASNNMKDPYTIYPGQQLSMPPGVYTTRVEAGESVYSIAKRYNVPMKVIIEANNLQYPYTIYINQLLQVPPGGNYYIIQQGDSLFSLAARFNTEVGLIQQANQNYSLYPKPGSRYVIPYPLPKGTGKLVFTGVFNGAYSILVYNFNTGAVTPSVKGIAGASTIPYLSPDGNKIAFTGNDGNVYVYQFKSDELLKINDTVDFTTYDWSIDSLKLVYTKGDSINIYDMSLKKTSKIEHTGALYAQWFPEGKELLFRAPDESGINQLYRIMEDGSDKKQLTKNTEDTLNDVRLSPNGAFVLYTTPGASISIIKTIELETGAINELPAGPLAKNFSPRWSPDSVHIAYSTVNYTGGMYYSLIRISDRFGRNVNTYAVSNCYPSPVAWLEGGRKIAFLSDCGNMSNTAKQIWVFSLAKPVPVPIPYDPGVSQLQVAVFKTR